MIVAVSDIHLGFLSRSNKDAFNQFLDRLKELKETGENIKHLVICGDFLEMWRRDLAGVVLENADTITKLQTLHEETDVTVHIVAGNHDYHLESLNDFAYPFSFCRELNLQSNGTSCRFIHGDQFDIIQRPETSEALCYTTDTSGALASEAWDQVMLMKKWWKMISAIFRREKKQDMEQSWIPPEVRLKPEDIDRVTRKACQDVKENELLIYGHTHHPSVRVDNNEKVKVVNCGSWLSYAGQQKPSHTNTYVEIQNGRVDILVFDPANPQQRQEITGQVTKACP